MDVEETEELVEEIEDDESLNELGLESREDRSRAMYAEDGAENRLDGGM